MLVKKYIPVKFIYTLEGSGFFDYRALNTIRTQTARPVLGNNPQKLLASFGAKVCHSLRDVRQDRH